MVKMGLQVQVIFICVFTLNKFSIGLDQSILTPLVPSNFYSIINHEKVALVWFQAPWCPHCKDMIAEMNSAAEELEEIGIAACTVDASTHRTLAGDLNVRGVPSFKLFVNGEGIDYEGPRDAIGLVSKVRDEAQNRGIKITAPMKPKCNSLQATQDRGGNGGHNDKCLSRGFVSFGLCEQKLSDSKDCNALTYKHGECYLHDRSMTDHWSDKTDGAIYVIRNTKELDRCV